MGTPTRHGATSHHCAFHPECSGWNVEGESQRGGFLDPPELMALPDPWWARLAEFFL